MITTPTTTAKNLPEQPAVPSKNGWPPLWRRLALAVVMLISLFMNFYQLGQNGFSNLYYAAAIRSMLDNLHNFFFVAFDPGGFVSIDKPPLGFWLQAASAKIFGFTPFSIFLPQALAGVLSVLLLYHLVRRHFGVIAGLLAALALAISPISVVTNRNNTIDSTLVLVMLLGAWAVLRAAETGKLRWTIGGRSHSPGTRPQPAVRRVGDGAPPQPEPDDKRDLLTSAADPAQFPAAGVPEIAFLGRSNVGKSSLLNSLVGEKMAHVSSTPGRTRTINFFEIYLRSNNTLPDLRFADLPGYGYAKISRSISAEWPKFIEPYLAEREPLRLCVCLIDSNVPPQPRDKQLFEWLRHAGRAFVVVATKIDRLSGNERFAYRAGSCRHGQQIGLGNHAARR